VKGDKTKTLRFFLSLPLWGLWLVMSVYALICFLLAVVQFFFGGLDAAPHNLGVSLIWGALASLVGLVALKIKG
jgi:hypothetical protein